ncbi:tol-pal system protein YbgF [uncultured Desulfovibrio sp.]|uniref:tol-pal system protein YbgF n=1 Tax=uncultured Desulfovibrio sp. TaxID=167968 RepID=UPI002628D28D|nr:tol-pal system protein YbgF [uncultured Desulfovibrio sp.]
MKIFVMAPLACLALVAGCAAADRQAESVETEQKLQRETDQRLRALEQSVSVLDTRVAQLNNRVYEVRTSRGKKTGMTVVPILPEQPAVAPAPATPGQQVALTTHGPAAQAGATPPKAQAAPSAPHARVIDPASPPQPPAAAAPQARRAPAPATPAPTPKTSAPAPQAASAPARAPAALGLPPESASAPAAPAAPAAAASRSAAAAAVPVPAVSGSDLALPPEKPGLGLPPAAAGPQSAGNAQGRVAAPTPSAPAGVAVPSTPAGVAAPSAQASPQPAAPRRGGKGEDAAYKEAVRPALAGRAGESIPRFQSFLQQYPDGRYAANAEYWIGEGYYSQGKYQEALAQFEKVNARYPRHHKNADALLKTAMTRSKMGDKAGAAEAYKQLLAQFPNSEAAQRARARGAAR